MKVFYLFVCIGFLIQNYSQGADDPAADKYANIDFSKIALACVTPEQLIKATAIACMQKENIELWEKVLECHRPIPDWVFIVFVFVIFENIFKVCRKESSLYH